jgi:hypothetical protein
MVQRIDDMPARTIGFRASGKLTRDDYRNGPAGRSQELGRGLNDNLFTRLVHLPVHFLSFNYYPRSRL